MKTLSKQLKTVFGASLCAILVGCSCLPKDPDIKPKQIVQRLGVCKQYKLTFGSTIDFTFEKNIPIEDCLVEGYFVLTDDEIATIRKEYKTSKKCFESQQGQCNNGN